MSENMFYYKPDELLSAAYETGDYNHGVIRKFVKLLRPENSIVHLWDSDFDTDDEWIVEKWYNGIYKETKIDAEDIARWSSTLPESSIGLRIPQLNNYIPNDFTLKAQPDTSSIPQYPVKLIEKENFRFWYKLDDKYGVPKTDFRVHLTSPVPYSSPRSMTQARLFERMLNDLLNCEFYDAALAGISYGVGVSVAGMNIRTSGYSQKVPLLTATLLERVQKLVFQLQDINDDTLVEKYTKALESLHRETANFNLDTPYEVANYNSRLLLEQSTWTIPQYLREMEKILDTDVEKAMAECGRIMYDCLFSKVCRIEAICMGNADTDDAMKFVELVERNFLEQSIGVCDEEVPRFRSIKIPTYAEAIRMFGGNEDVQYPLAYEEVAQGASENNNAIELHLQVGPEAVLKYDGVAILDIIGQIAYTSAFQTLRTEEQLGYIVSAYPRSVTGGSHGFSVVVQSSSKLPHELEERCEAWLIKFRQELNDMTDNDISAAAGAVVSQLLERDTRFSQEVSRMWGQIVSTVQLPLRDNEPVFNRLEKLASVIDLGEEDCKMTASDLKGKILEMFDTHFVVDSPRRRAFSSRVYGKSSKHIFEQNTGKPGILQGHDDILDFKLGLETLPMTPYWK